jgi:Zn finger protein HypA/HybF involved in hydrogenase expression
MTLEELTLEIYAERALTYFESKHLVTWAINVLTLGYESENLYILGGLDNASTEEREIYFWKSIADLKLNIEKSEADLMENYALTIAKKAISEEVSIEYAFSQMRKIVSASGYNYRYIAFYEIDEDMDYLNYNNSPLYNPGLTLENSKEFILEEMKIFVEMEDLNISREQRHKYYCETCKNLTGPITKNKFQLKKPFRYTVMACGICGSEKLKYNSNHDVKRKIIEQSKKNN